MFAGVAGGAGYLGQSLTLNDDAGVARAFFTVAFFFAFTLGAEKFFAQDRGGFYVGVDDRLVVGGDVYVIAYVVDAVVIT